MITNYIWFLYSNDEWGLTWYMAKNMKLLFIDIKMGFHLCKKLPHTIFRTMLKHVFEIKSALTRQINSSFIFLAIYCIA